MSEHHQRLGQASVVALCLLVLAVCVATIVYVAEKPGVEPPPPTPPPGPTEQEKIKFFEDQVEPVVAEFDKHNRQAADRCIAKIRNAFKKYRQGVDPFLEDITSLSTRFGIIRRMPGDWWHERNDVEAYIGEIFEEHLFSEAGLRKAIEDALAAYQDDIKANETKLRTSILAAVNTADRPGLPSVDFDELSAEVTRLIKDFATRSAVDSVTSLIIVEIASGAAGSAAGYLLTSITAQLATMVVTSAAAGGGAAATGAAAGGGGGSIVGPAGTVVGGVVGLILGLGIDWWMTENLKEKLGKELNGMIGQIEKAVIDGSDERTGLTEMLDEACDALRAAYSNALRQRIVGDVL